MKLAFYIFWKDARYLWREIAVSLALLIASGWIVPREWADPGFTHAGATSVSALAGVFFENDFWTRLLLVLLPVSWLFAVVRAIQSDSLVGNRQFWLTRPYDWKQLLAAKCLFILAFVNLPLLILDLYLLARAGFAPAHYMVGLLWMQWLITLILVIPIAALATLTTTVVQLLLTLLVIVLYMVGSSFVAERFPAASFTSTEPLPTILLIATPLAVIGLQYARRRTILSRSLILGLMAALVLITVFAPYRTLISRQYATLTGAEQPPLQLALGKNLGTWTSVGNPDRTWFGISLPVIISRSEPDSILILKGSQVEVDGSNGLHWDAGWTSMNSMHILPGQSLTTVSFALPVELYQQLRYADVKLHVTLAFTYFRDATQRTFVVPAGTFALPEGDLCSTPPDDAPRVYGRLHIITCLAPLHGPTSLYVKLKLTESTCPLPEGSPNVPDDATGSGWLQSSESPAEFGVSPVAQFSLAPFVFSNLYHPHAPGSDDRPHDSGAYASLRFDNSRYMLHGICPGTPIILSNPQKVRDMQITQQFDKVHLPDNGRPLEMSSPMK